MAKTTTLSSAGTSVPITLNPVYKSTTVQLTVASGSSGAATFIQFSLDDPIITTPVWANLSSAIVSSGADGSGIIYTVLSPLFGLRLSSAGTVTGTVTLKSLQAVTA